MVSSQSVPTFGMKPYGPEIVGHEIILSRHPVIDSQGGTLVNGTVYEEIKSRESHKEDPYGASFDVRLIKILDEEALNQLRYKYDDYIEPVEFISKLFLEHNLKDQITLSYNAILKRDVFKKSHNILGIREATGDIVWRTLCRNLKRMEKWPKPEYVMGYPTGTRAGPLFPGRTKNKKSS